VTAFFDTNVVAYALDTQEKSPAAMTFLRKGGKISVQVLNELTNVWRKKLRRSWPDVEHGLRAVRDLTDEPLPLTVEMHETAIALARDHNIPIYDALIVAAALEGGCDTLYSEDLQHGRRFARLAIVNPFL